MIDLLGRRQGGDMTHPTLITGGAGFIGSHLCEKLLQNGSEVLCVDDLSTGDNTNLIRLLKYKNFQFEKQNVCIPLNADVEDVYNLACPASPLAFQKDPISTTKTAVLGAINLLELALKSGSKIFQASTSEVYGDPEVHPQPEWYWGNVNPIGTRACYDEGKRCAESLFFDYRRIHKIEIRVARIFNTYGPHMHINDGRAVCNFITQALRNDPITIFGTGDQTRSFCYVDDLVDGILCYMNQPDGNSPTNIGNPTEITIAELADLICMLCGSSSKVKFVELPTDDPKLRKPDISRIQKLCGWKPKVTLEDGLKETIQYFKKLVV